MRDILIIGLIIAVVVILIRVAMGTPMIKRVMESFSGSMDSTTPECPLGSTFYKYGDAVFCCSGKIKTDASSAKGSCSPLRSTKDDLTFCTLGQSLPGIPNCMNTKEKRYRDLAKQVCPPSAPNYVQGEPFSATEHGRCCAGPVNADRTACVSDTGSCDVAAPGTNILKTLQPSCQMKKMLEGDGACPSSATMTMVPSTEEKGMFTGFNHAYCIRNDNMCMTKAMKDTLHASKYEDYNARTWRELPQTESGFLDWIKTNRWPPVC